MLPSVMQPDHCPANSGSSSNGAVAVKAIGHQRYSVTNALITSNQTSMSLLSLSLGKESSFKLTRGCSTFVSGVTGEKGI